MPECGSGHNQPRNDLVADAQINCRVKAVMTKPNPGGQGDHIARKQRKLHPRLTLGNAIAHGRNSPGNLRRRAGVACGLADDLWEMLKRLMRRKHIVIGGNDTKIGCLFGHQRILVACHGSICMGLVATGQMRTSGAVVNRLSDAL